MTPDTWKIAGGIVIGLTGFVMVIGLAKLATQGAGVGRRGVGAKAVFPVNDQSVDTVEEVTLHFMDESHSEPVISLALEIFNMAGVSNFDSESTRAQALHRFVADVVPYEDDPAGFESIMSPAEHAELILSAMRDQRPIQGSDCDDTALLLAALATSQGIHSSVAYLDTNGDEDIDHAITIMVINGHPTYAETTMSGAELGWSPQSSIVEVLDLS